jgi:hypothetical protein
MSSRINIATINQTTQTRIITHVGLLFIRNRKKFARNIAIAKNKTK